MDKCLDCEHAKVIKGYCHGVMDCEPDEVYCDIDCEEFYDDEEDCPNYRLRIFNEEDYN